MLLALPATRDTLAELTLSLFSLEFSRADGGGSPTASAQPLASGVPQFAEGLPQNGTVVALAGAEIYYFVIFSRNKFSFLGYFVVFSSNGELNPPSGRPATNWQSSRTT